MTKNNLLSEKLNYTGISQTPTHLHLCSYNPEGVHDCNGKDIDEMIPHLQPNSINWIQIHGLQNTETVQKVCQHFGIDFLVTQDILNADHLTKIEEHENYNVIILKQLTAEKDNNYLSQQLCIIQGENFLLTFVEKETEMLNEIHTALEKNVLKIRNRQTDFLLSVILNSVMTSFMSIISDLEDELEDMEGRLLSSNPAEMPGIEEIQQYRRIFRLIKKSILPLKEHINKLLHSDNTLLHKSNRPFFNDVNDHLQFVLQTLEGCRDMISALVDLYLSNNDQRMNGICAGGTGSFIDHLHSADILSRYLGNEFQLDARTELEIRLSFCLDTHACNRNGCLSAVPQKEMVLIRKHGQKRETGYIYFPEQIKIHHPAIHLLIKNCQPCERKNYTKKSSPISSRPCLWLKRNCTTKILFSSSSQ